ncbi:MAG: phage portal protein [Clostridiales bacterium]|nr:phage portal protein [Clostridiales bacterium]
MELFGRRQIFTTTEKITADNVIAELNAALSVHVANMMEMEYLYWYRRGTQPILNREKVVRKEINNKITENHASEIVAFKNGYFLTQPAFYISRKEDKDVTDRVKRLNEYLYLSGKQQVDNKVADWFHTVGIGVVYVEPYPDEAIPVRAYALDPRSAFVVYSRNPGHEPVMGVNVVVTGKNENTSQAVFDVYTRDTVFRISGGITGRLITDSPVIATATDVIGAEDNRIGEIPIIEYQYDSNRMGAFETVIPLLDSINNVQSNRIDGIEQFIQSLMVFYNCQLGDDKQGNPITPAYIREAGAIFLKSIGQDKADLKILSEQLDQTQTQVLVDYLYQQVLTICGMPSTTKGGTSTSDTGAAVLYRDGWYQADTVARNTEDLFKESNRRFDAVFIKILNQKTDLNVVLSDFELKFVRNETANILVKTQAAMNLKELGFSPELAFAKSGLSNDPVADVANSQKYIEEKWSVSDKSDKEDVYAALDGNELI